MKEIDKRDEVGCTALYNACSDDSMRKIKKLLAAGADPNIPEVNGITPLMESASGGDLEAVKLLLAYGANPHRKDNFGDTAITYAQSQGFKKVVRHLELVIKRSH